MTQTPDLWETYVGRAFTFTSKVKHYYRAHSTKGSPYIPVATEGLIEIIQKMSGFADIEILELDRSAAWQPKHFKSQIFKFGGDRRAKIIIPPLKTDHDDDFGVTRCERRFAVVKEICHLLIDDPATVEAKISDLVRSIVNNAQAIMPIGIKDPLILQENVAELAALELLIWHEHWSDRFSKVNTGELTDFCVATEFLIPECKIASLRSQHELIQKHREQYNEALDNFITVFSAMPAKLSFDHAVTW